MASEQIPAMKIVKGINGLEKVVLREAGGSSVELYLNGAHVTSWKNKKGEELLFVSRKSNFEPYKPIRGGIPICFPQFSDRGPLENHGFARTRIWRIDHNLVSSLPTVTANSAKVDLILKPSSADLKLWPHSFEFRLRVTLGPGGELMLTSRIRNTNTDGKPFSFTFAYQNYFSVSDISEVCVEGLKTLDYIDNLKGKGRLTDQGDALTFEAEVDKTYLNTTTEIAILDHQKNHNIVLEKEGLPDAVIWNPWAKKAKAMPDFGEKEYERMLCVESAAVDMPITLKPGEEWTGKQQLSVVYSTSNSGQLSPNSVSISEPIRCETNRQLKRRMFKGIDLYNSLLEIGEGEPGIGNILRANAGKHVLVTKGKSRPSFELFFYDDDAGYRYTPSIDITGHTIVDCQGTWLLLRYKNKFFRYDILDGSTYMLPMILEDDLSQDQTVVGTFVVGGVTVLMWMDREVELMVHRDGESHWDKKNLQIDFLSDVPEGKNLQIDFQHSEISGMHIHEDMIVAITSSNLVFGVKLDGSCMWQPYLPKLLEEKSCDLYKYDDDEEEEDDDDEDEDEEDDDDFWGSLVKDPTGTIFFLGLSLDTLGLAGYQYYIEMAPVRQGRSGTDIRSVLGAVDILVTEHTGLTAPTSEPSPDSVYLYHAKAGEIESECTWTRLYNSGETYPWNSMKECLSPITESCCCSFAYIINRQVHGGSEMKEPVANTSSSPLQLG